MKKHKLLWAMSLADDKFISESDPSQDYKIIKRRKLIRVWGAVAACLCCALIGFNLWLFVPLDTSAPDVSEYSDSEYYDIIVKLNEVTYRKPRYKNNFERYFSGIFKGAKAEDNMEMGTAGTVLDGGSGEYVEVTDNQVQGVIEGDLFKRSDKYLYYLNGETMEIYSIAGETSALVGSYTVTGADDMKYRYSEITMYLSNDGTTVTLIYPYYSKDNTSCISFEALDVSDPSNVTLKKRVRMSGTYLSSRLTNGEFLTLTQFYVNYNPDFSDESKFVPQIDAGEGYESIPVDNIISPEKLNSARYTVICKLDAQSLELRDSSAFLSYSDDVYVSQDNAYVTRLYTESEIDGDIYITRQMTQISRMPYSGEEFGEVSTFEVEGYVKDQYSMDEYEGLLRVVTTTDVYEEVKTQNTDSYHEIEDILLVSRSGDTNANLYVIDLNTSSIRAQVTAFAPQGEVVQSVRFDGSVAYVCTSVELKDPVFFFDLSDPDNITVKQTGTIEGFSTSLVNMGDGALLGIGIGSDRSTLKLEVYEETETGIVSVCKYELDDVSYSTDYKSYYIDRENGLIGLGVTRNYNNPYENSKANGRYLLVHFDGYRLRNLLDVELDGSDAEKRGVYIDGYMYMLGSDGLKVERIEK